MADRATFAEQALESAQSLYSAALQMTGNRHDAEDLVQETYLRAYRRFDTFRAGTNIAAWLRRILVNVYIDSHRSRLRRPLELSLDGLEDLGLSARLTSQRGAIGRSAEEELLARPSDDVTQELADLPPQLRLPVELASLRGLSYRTIAQQLGLPIGTVTSRLHRGRKALRQRLHTKGLF